MTCASGTPVRAGLSRRATALFSLGFVLLFPQAGQAQTPPLTFFKNYFVTGDYVVRGTSLWRKGINGKATASIPPLGGPDGVPLTADILAAFLYVQTAEKIQGSGIDRARFTGHNLGPFRAPGSLEPGSGTFAKALVNWDTATSPCWSVAYPGQRKLITYRVDVLRFLPIDPVTQKHSLTTPHQIVVPDAGLLFGDDDEGKRESGSSNLPRAVGASLVVVYRDAAKPFSAVVLYDGAFTKRAFARMDQPIEGFYQASAANPSAKMTHIVGDGRPFLSERVYLGGTLIATNPFVSSLGPKWDNTTFPNAAFPHFPLPPGAAETRVTVDRHGLLSDCLSYSAMVFRTTVEDGDEDGLITRWETDAPLYDPHGRELPHLNEMGADPRHKDLFADISYMETRSATSPHGLAGVTYGGVLKPHHTHLPTLESLQMVSETLKNAPVPNPDGSDGINVHFDVGDNYQGYPFIIPTLSPTTGLPLARGGEALDELMTICRPDLLDPSKDPWVCQFSDYSDDGTGGYPGTVGWKTGYRFLRDGLLNPLPDSTPHACDAPGNDGPGETCERLFDQNRLHMFRFVFSAHHVGIPQAPCLKADGTADITCQKTNPGFHVPRTYSAIADFPGGDVLLALGGFDDDEKRPVGTPYQQGATLLHEWGHNWELKHGGPANPKIGGVIVPQIPREPNCKPNYLSVMNYLFQLRGLPDVDGILRMDLAREEIPALNETGLPEAPLGSQLYRTGWYAPFSPNANVKAATKHCDGSELTPAEIDSMMRVDATGVTNPIDWNADGDISGSPSQDINFNGVIDAVLKASTSDWDHIRLNELAARRNVGGRYRDTLGRLAVGPMSLDVGQGDIGQGDIGQGDIGQGDIGQGDIGQGDIGQGDIGQGDIGQGDIGQGDIGQGDIGRGLFGGGDLDVGGTDEPVFEIDPPTAEAAEGGAKTGPPSGLMACLTSESELCVTHPAEAADASTPVNLRWDPPTLGPGNVVSYQVYRFVFEGEFVAPAPENLPTEAIATVVEGTSYSDSGAPAGAQLAYFIKATWVNDETDESGTTGISNFDTVTTPSAPVVLNFDGFEDQSVITTQYASQGVTFTGATTLTAGVSLNPAFPPRSGTGVIFDNFSSEGLITATFASPVTRAGGYVTGNTVITLRCFDGESTELGSALTPGPNRVGDDFPPNHFLEVNSPGIARCTFTDSGNTYTVDDFTFAP